jgi:type VI secretion system protein ImpH
VIDALWQALVAAPWSHGFFPAVRRIESAHPHLPKLGTARHRSQEPVRFGQWPSMSFAPATLGRIRPPADGRPAALGVRFFGVWGPNGPLPLHLTEFARERCRRTPADRAMVAFVDLFHHRLLTQLYRAWADGEPVIDADRPRASGRSGPLERMLLAWAGRNPDASSNAPPADITVALACAGGLCGGVRSACAARQVLQAALGVEVRVREWPCRWLPVPRADRLVLSARGNARPLGLATTLGARVRDASATIRFDLGPLTRARHERLQPGGADALRLREIVGLVTDASVRAEIGLVVRAGETPAPRIGPNAPALGHAFWIGAPPRGPATGRTQVLA